MYSNFTEQQTMITDSPMKSVSFLFDVIENGNTHYWSDKPRVYNGNSYTYKILERSPIKLSKIDGHIVGKNEMSIVLDNPGNTLATTDYKNAAVTVRIIISADLAYKSTDHTAIDYTIPSDVQESEIRTICFEVYGKPINLLQQMHLECRGWLEKYIDGDYPNTSLVSDLWPSESAEGTNDNTCIPKIWGTAFIPIRWAFITDAIYYILGPYSGTYDITKIKSPREYGGDSTWLESDYTFQESSKAGSDGNNYSAWKFLIAASIEGGPADANGLFKSGTKFLDPPCQYSWSGTSSMTQLPDIIEYFLEDCGVPSAKIDDTSKDIVATTQDGWGISYSGGFWYKRDREEIFKEFLAQGHIYLIQRDKLYFNIYDKTSQLKIEKWHCKGDDQGETIIDRYSITRCNTDDNHDSGYVAFQNSDRPFDELHKLQTKYKSTSALPSSDCVDMPFVHNSQHAKKLGTLFFQRDKLRDSDHRQVFNERILQLECGDTITINPIDYDGGGFDAVIESMSINNDLSINMEFTSYSVALDNWDDVTASSVSIVADDSDNVFQNATTGPDTPGQIGDARPNVAKGKWIIPDGRNLELIGSDTSPGKVKWTGTSYAVELGGDVDGNRFMLYPTIDGEIDLLIGGQSWWDDNNRFYSIKLISKWYTEITSGLDETDNNYSTIRIDSGLSSTIFLKLRDGITNNTTIYSFKYNQIYPDNNKSVDLGLSGNAWDDVYADDFQNVADFPFLDDKDDLAELHKIKGSGIIDSRSGLEIIDDNTLPEWMLTKDKKTGKIVKNLEGKPYITLKLWESLNSGCIRQLHKIVKQLEQEIKFLKRKTKNNGRMQRIT